VDRYIKSTRDKRNLLDKMDPQIWGKLPYELVEKICNLLIKVRHIHPLLKNDIVYQWYKFDTYYWRLAGMFGVNNVLYVMYDDMKNVAGVIDDFPEEMAYEEVIREMWKKTTHEDRNELLITN
jgi:hypothetical protein